MSRIVTFFFSVRNGGAIPYAHIGVFKAYTEIV